MAYWIIITLTILVTLFLASIIAGFLFYRKFKWKNLAEKIEIMFFSIERQKYLELQTLIKRLVKNKKAEEFTNKIKQEYEQIKDLRSKLSSDIIILQEDLKHKKMDKKFFNNAWKKHLELDHAIERFKNDVAAIFEKIDLNLSEYKKITLDLPEAIKIKDFKYAKNNISHDMIDLKLQFVASKNKNLKASLGNDDYEGNKKTLIELKEEILNLYMLINDFVEINAEIKKVVPQLIEKIKQKHEQKLTQENTLSKIGIGDLLTQIDTNYQKTQDSFNQGLTEQTKEFIKDIYIKIQLIEQKIKEEIYYSNFIKINKQTITDSINKTNLVYKEIIEKLQQYNQINLFKNNINLQQYIMQLNTLYKNIGEAWKLTLSQSTKKEFALSYKDVIFKIKNFVNLINQLEKNVFDVQNKKQYQLTTIPKLELLVLSLEELIVDENIIVLPKNETLLVEIKQLHRQLIDNLKNLDDKLMINENLLSTYKEKIAQLLQVVGKDIEIKKVSKIIIQELNAQRTTTKELNANLKLMEKLILDGDYQKALDEFIKYLKRRK